MRYVCGFAFDGTMTSVLLMHKLKGPINMAGKLNGIGGKIELGESPLGAMKREFKEEVSFPGEEPEWLLFHKMVHQNQDAVYFYAAHWNNLSYYKARAREAEVVIPVSVHALLAGNCNPQPVYNLPYLLPMAHVYLNYPDHRWLQG